MNTRTTIIGAITAAVLFTASGATAAVALTGCTASPPDVTVPAGTAFDYVTYVDMVTGHGPHDRPTPPTVPDLLLPAP